MLSEITPIFLKLSSGENLTTEESMKAFNIVGDEDKEGYFFTALTMGIMAKGPTVDELQGFCLDRKDRVGTLKTNIRQSNIIDLAGGGGDKIKTMNVSTAACFVLAAGGVFVAKQSAKAFTGFTGSSDILEALGIKIPTDKVDKEKIAKCLKSLGIIAYNYAALAPERFINFLHWRQKVVEIGLKYYIPWHIASFVYSAVPMENRIYGLANPKYMILLAKLLHRLGYKKIMVVHGVDGLDEISIIGKTKVVEVQKNNFKEYEITSKDLGIKTASIDDITNTSKEENISDFVRVLLGKDRGSKHDLVAANAGAGFYLVGKTKTLREGVEFASNTMKSGKAFKKLEEFVKFNRGSQQLKNWIDKVIH